MDRAEVAGGREAAPIAVLRSRLAHRWARLVRGCASPAVPRSLALALFGGTAYGSMEWLFFATKPSVVSDSTGFFGPLLYGDPLHLNVKDGFQRLSGGRRDDLSTAPDRLERSGIIHPATTLFLQQSAERFVLRIRHALGIMRMDNPHAVVTAPESTRSVDAALHEELSDFLRSAPEPFLVHAHFLGTHGPTFHPQRRVFSRGRVDRRTR